ncbi:MAG TPA: DUF2267 domain-containing protein [Candidatus Nanoarchaeia archaeon]|nr:DUF2267 domain-containing protein [Candidatus Nanoarchaeia archaeon]
MIRSIERSLDKTYEWFNDIQKELGWENPQMAFEASKAVLQTLRDRLPVEEAAEFAAGLPMLMKGVYYEGYKPSRKPKRIKKAEDFYAEVQKRTTQPIQPEDATKAVLTVIESKISRGEIEDVLSNIPTKLRQIFIPKIK